VAAAAAAATGATTGAAAAAGGGLRGELKTDIGAFYDARSAVWESV